MKMHPKITQRKILGAVKRALQGLDNPGFCIACGAEADYVEPDARKCECEVCGELKVYGAEELMMMTV